ncbi:unnamed protein product [Polarella glacialis]|uniref:Peroxisomal membrane protein PEX14-like KPWE domain-containing protein n=1 Tax=Polarella glacialis TaxID=89957 RepID=A0A813H158_POLGL|nr:unnamed protein product [Polarella glacialis]
MELLLSLLVLVPLLVLVQVLVVLLLLMVLVLLVATGKLTYDTSSSNRWTCGRVAKNGDALPALCTSRGILRKAHSSRRGRTLVMSTWANGTPGSLAEFCASGSPKNQEGPESEAGQKAEAAAELRAQLREELAAESKRLEVEKLRPMEAQSIRLEQEVNRLHARSRELRAEMDAVSAKFVKSRERQRSHMAQVDGWRTDFYQVMSSKSQSQQEVDSQAELANQRKQLCSDLISAVTLLTSSQTIPAITGSHQASLNTEVVQAEKDHTAAALGLRAAAEARLAAAAADVRDWQKEDARAVAELQLLGVGCAESQLPTRSQLPSLVEQLRVACAGFRQAEIAAAGACAKSSNVSAALLLAETEDLLIELLQKVPPELAALAAANRSSTCDAPVVSSMASASSRSFTAGGMQAATAAVRPARSGPSPIATSLFSDLDENRPFTPISSPLGGGAGISKPARVQLASCRLEEKLVAEGDQLKAGDFAGLMALAEEAAAGQVPTGPNAVSEPKDLELRTRLEEVMEARGKGVMTQELKNATTILGRLMQDMSNTKLHEMRRDVLLRTVGEDLLFVFESAGFREGQRKEGGASFLWHGSDTPLLLRVAVHEVQRASDSCLDADAVSFADVSDMVQSGRTLPGIQDVDDAVREALPPKDSDMSLPKKPWEK